MPQPFARKSLGQHFLSDRTAVERIVAALEIEEGDPLLEIGPGRGALTADLVAAAGRIAAVELDDVLAAELGRRFEPSRLLLVRGDVLRLGFGDLLTELRPQPGRRLVLAGNLPYNISKPVAQKLVREREHVDRAVLMFQREVAERLTATPGSRRYGPLSVLAGSTYRIRSLFDLPPSAFRPRPAVFSTVTLWNRRAADALDRETESRLRAVLAVSFARRRRTLRNNLRSVLPDDAAVVAFLREVDLDGEQRPESVSPQAFLRMARCWGDHSV